MTRRARQPARLHCVPVAFGSRDSVAPTGLAQRVWTKHEKQKHAGSRVIFNCH